MILDAMINEVFKDFPKTVAGWGKGLGIGCYCRI